MCVRNTENKWMRGSIKMTININIKVKERDMHRKESTPI